MRNAGFSSNPNWWLAAMVATGSWFGVATPDVHPRELRAGLLGVGPMAAPNWAARTLAPVRAAGCAAGLVLLLIWGTRALAWGSDRAAAARPAQPAIAAILPLHHIDWLRSLRRGGRYGP